MKLLKNLLCLLAIAVFACVSADAKNYSSKAVRPTASDHTWSGYDYDFNLDDSGMLTGTNTFSIVYNTTPPRWYNNGFALYKKTCTTGSETLTIIVLPGDFNYVYTLKSDITIWDWDSHELKWVKRNQQPYNGTRTFKVKNGIVDGEFEFPVKTLLPDVCMIYGTAFDGLVPSNGKIGWKCYDRAKYTVKNTDEEIIPVGDNIRLSVGTYMTDVLGQKSNGMKYEETENGTAALLSFPITKPDILAMCGRDAGVGESLERYAYIVLPDFYYDDYVDPYAPVETILPNGHRLVKTLKREGGLDEIEYWESDGYSYKQEKGDNDRHPITGERVSNDTTFVHVIDKRNYFEEKGFFIKGKYHMTYLKDNRSTTTIDWTPLAEKGYYIIHEKGADRYAVENDENTAHVFPWPTITPRLNNVEYGGNVIKVVGDDGSLTVAASNTDELSDAAKKYIKTISHPYLISLFRQTYPDVNKNFMPSEIYAIAMSKDGNVIRTYSNSDEEMKKLSGGRARIEYENQLSLWNKYMESIMYSGKNPLDEIASQIAMELDVPDYDVTKVDAKVTGKRTAALLKTLCRLLKQKSKGETRKDSYGRTYRTYFPNNAKKCFTHENKLTNYKSVEIGRVVKNGNKIAVHVVTKEDDGKAGETVLVLEDNIPVDEYAEVWKSVVVNM